MFYEKEQAAISVRWLTLQTNVFRSQLTAAISPDDRTVREAKGDREEFLSLASKYIAWELPKRRFEGIPPLDPETQRNCEDLYDILERHIDSGSEGAEERLAVMKVVRDHAAGSVTNVDMVIAGLFHKAHYIRKTRTSTASVLTDARHIIGKIDMVIRSFEDSVSASRRSTERGNITPASRQSKTVEWMSMDDRIDRAQRLAEETPGQPHPGNVESHEERIYEKWYKPSPPSPSPLPRATLLSKPSVSARTSDQQSLPVVRETPERDSPAPLGKRGRPDDEDRDQQAPLNKRRSRRLRDRAGGNGYAD